MKKKLFFSIINFFLSAFLPCLVQADSVSINIINAVKQLGIEGEIRKELPGNETTVGAEKAELLLSSEKVSGDISFRLHIKDRHCIYRRTGCIDSYNAFTSIGVRFDLVKGCVVQGVDVYKYGSYGVSAADEAMLALAHELFVHKFKDEWQLKLNRLANEKIKYIADPAIKMLCGS